MTLQIYFFSCVFLVIAGSMLSYDKFGSLLKLDLIFKPGVMKHRLLSLIVSVACFLFGVLLILQGGEQDVVIIGDFVPGLFAIVGGLALFFQTNNKSYTGENKYVLAFQSFIQTNISIIGVLMIILGVIHAVFPTVRLL